MTPRSASIASPDLRRPLPSGPPDAANCPIGDRRRSAVRGAVLVLDLEGRVMHADGEAFEAHGLVAGNWIGRAVEDLLEEAQVPELLPRLHTALDGAHQSFAFATPDGSFDYWIQLTPIRDHAGELTSIIAVSRDITGQIQVSADLARSQARLREAERLIGVGSWEMSLATSEVTFSEGFARLVGIAPDATHSLAEHLSCVHRDDRTILTDAGRHAIETGSATCAYRYAHPDGSDRILSLRTEVVRGATGRREFLRGAVLDVTEQRRTERERLDAESRFRQGFDATAIATALIDPVTGHCSRVNDAMCRLLSRSREEVLGRPLLSFAHPEDEPAVRGASAAMHAGECSSYEAEHRFLRPDGSAAWGLLTFTPVRRSDGSVELFYCQLIDISEAKHREERLDSDTSEAMWLRRVRDALAEDRLVLYAQPIVDLTTGETVQHELLLRMRDEDGTIIPPGDFLPAAERYGLIAEIDRWVIRSAVAIAAEGKPTEFNLSARSIGDPTVLAELADAIASSGVDPSLLVVEVTETAFVHQTDAGHEFVRRVRELGCRLALDDFGTGFSSLSRLKHLQADHLKIDIEFVRELTRSETDARVIRGIVGLARDFNQTTVAEGVEDEATLLKLRELGVDLAQGYLFGRPAPFQTAPECPAATRPATVGAGDPADLVRRILAGVNRRDVAEIVSLSTPDVVLRPLVTGRVSGPATEYRGPDGVQAYISAVDDLFDEAVLVPSSVRVAGNSVIAFGHIDARRGDARASLSVMWLVKIEGDRVASIEVFMGSDANPEQGPARLRRLVEGEPAPVSR